MSTTVRARAIPHNYSLQLITWAHLWSPCRWLLSSRGKNTMLRPHNQPHHNSYYRPLLFQLESLWVLKSSICLALCLKCSRSNTIVCYFCFLSTWWLVFFSQLAQNSLQWPPRDVLSIPSSHTSRVCDVPCVHLEITRIVPTQKAPTCCESRKKKQNFPAWRTFFFTSPNALRNDPSGSCVIFILSTYSWILCPWVHGCVVTFTNLLHWGVKTVPFFSTPPPHVVIFAP